MSEQAKTSPVNQMAPKTLKALQGSIKKWEGIVAGTAHDLGSDNCPLCKMFAYMPNCDGCPVAERTGVSSCCGSPYYDYKDGIPGAAQAELDFLKSLLPGARS